MATQFEELKRRIYPGVLTTKYGPLEILPFDHPDDLPGTIEIRTPRPDGSDNIQSLTVNGVAGLHVYGGVYRPDGDFHLSQQAVWTVESAPSFARHPVEDEVFVSVREALKEVAENYCTPQYVADYLNYQRLTKLIADFNRVQALNAAIADAVATLKNSHAEADELGLTDIYREVEANIKARITQ